MPHPAPRTNHPLSPQDQPPKRQIWRFVSLALVMLGIGYFAHNYLKATELISPATKELFWADFYKPPPQCVAPAGQALPEQSKRVCEMRKANDRARFEMRWISLIANGTPPTPDPDGRYILP